MLQRHRQAIGQESHQNMSFHAMFQWMVDRTNAQIAVQAFESRFDLRQLHVSIPPYGWIFGYPVRTQPMVAIPQLGLFQFGLVQLQGERLPRHLLTHRGQVDLYESKSW